jgi:very-short-patch-repair endonuclease
MIPLTAWAKKVGIGYSQARKLFLAGKLPTATIIKNIQNKSAVYLPAETEFSYPSVTLCRLCGKGFAQITLQHLKKVHGTDLTAYMTQFPDASITSANTSAAISAYMTGRTLSDETKEKISINRSGIEAWNRGLSGVVTDSPETIEKKRQSHIGLRHTEEAKQKIGNAHRGKYIPPETIERARQGIIKHYETHCGYFTGKSHTPEAIALMSELAIAREAGYSLERAAEIAEKRGAASRGLKRTEEQKVTYRKSRVKWMSENPEKVINTTGEKTLASWLDHHRINYVRQYLIPDFWHPYDFFLPDHNTIIEFDGAHHWWRPWFNVMGKTKAEKERMMEAQLEKDAVENMVAGVSGYQIIRIRGVADCGDSPEYGSLEYQLELQGFELPQ